MQKGSNNAGVFVTCQESHYCKGRWFHALAGGQVVRHEGRHGGTPPRPTWADKMVATPCMLPSPHPWGPGQWIALSQPKVSLEWWHWWGGPLASASSQQWPCFQSARGRLCFQSAETEVFCRNFHTSFLSHTAQAWLCRLGCLRRRLEAVASHWQGRAVWLEASCTHKQFRTCQTMSKMCELELFFGHENGPTNRKPELFHRYFSLA